VVQFSSVQMTFMHQNDVQTLVQLESTCALLLLTTQTLSFVVQFSSVQWHSCIKICSAMPCACICWILVFNANSLLAVVVCHHGCAFHSKFSSQVQSMFSLQSVAIQWHCRAKKSIKTLMSASPNWNNFLMQPVSFYCLKRHISTRAFQWCVNLKILLNFHGDKNYWSFHPLAPC